MIPASCKRLIEVDFPIAAVSEHSAREKSIRHGHPSTLHLWWARRPLAACRSVLLGLLLPDPCDTDCPADFKTSARELLATNRLLLDSPAARDRRTRLLLEDLELVLAEIAQLTPQATAGDRELIREGMERGGVLSRLRTVVPAGTTPTRGDL